MILPGASSLIEAIGLVAGSIDVVRFGLNNFAPVAPGGTGNTSVRIGLGLETNNVLGIQTYTALPDIRLFNESGGFVGMAANSGHFSKNGRGDIKINIGKHKDRGKRPTYTIFSANEHALCIAYASITWPGGDMYAFDGGWGRACGGPWYYSNYYVSTEKVNPTCMWVDGNNGDIREAGFQVHWPDFVPHTSTFPDDQAKKVDMMVSLCQSGTSFKYHYEKVPKSLTYKIPDNLSKGGSRGGESRLSRRTTATTSHEVSRHPVPAHDLQDQGNGKNSSIQTRGAVFLNRLVIDDSLERPPQKLCASSTSFGPDFVNVAYGTYCRMSDKTLWLICQGKSTTHCFDLKFRSLTTTDQAPKRLPYTDVIDWRNANAERANQAESL